LTIKFTRCTASSVVSRSSLANHFRLRPQSHRIKSWRLPFIARTRLRVTYTNGIRHS
jgi:hypothetical protein